MFMDEKGRFWGKLSVVDLLIGVGLLFTLGILQFGGMVVRHHHLAVYRVLPNPAIPGEGKPVSVLGTGFSNGCRVRLGHMQEETARFINEAILEVDTPEDLEPGSYPVRVRSALGRFAQLPEGLHIRWNPRIERIEPKRTYPGERVEIHGRYFDSRAVLHLGNIPLHPLDRESWDRLPMKLEADQPIPPGQYDVTMSNPGGGSQTAQQAIEVLPRPRVVRVYPDVVTYGEKVMLTIEGENLPKDAVFYFDEGGRQLGGVTWISPQRVKVPLEVGPGLADWYSLLLKIPDGPKILVKPKAIRVVAEIPMAFLVKLDIRGLEPETVEAFQQLPESRLAGKQEREGSAADVPERLPIILWGRVRSDPSGTTRTFWYQDNPLTIGRKITVHLFGHEMTGRLLEQPVPIGTGDEWRRAVADGTS